AYLLDTHGGTPFSIDQDGAVVGGINSHRFPAYVELDFHVEWRMTLLRKRLAPRAGFNNVTELKHPPFTARHDTHEHGFRTTDRLLQLAADHRIRHEGGVLVTLLTAETKETTP